MKKVAIIFITSTIVWVHINSREETQFYPSTENWIKDYLTRMEAKDLVYINKEVTPHIYCAKIDRESCRKKERHSFLNRVYSGSAGDLIAAFLKEEPISQEEREKLRKILDDMEV